MAASRRRRGKSGSHIQVKEFITEVRLQGEARSRDRRIFGQLVSHVCQNAGLRLSPFEANGSQQSGFWKHLASFDPSAPPGKARLYLDSQDEVQRVYHALHGQLVQVGNDWMSVTVHNDILEAAPLAGNGSRAP